MNREQKRDFTRRISQCNRGGMIVVIYDIIFAYMKEAKESLAADNYRGFRDALVKSQRGIDVLIQALDFQYPVAKELYPLYVFAKESLAKAVIKKSTKEMEGAQVVLENLYAAFTEAAKQDLSAPLMQNAQQVYAGITYGKTDLTETFQDPETSRGFFA